MKKAVPGILGLALPVLMIVLIGCGRSSSGTGASSGGGGNKKTVITYLTGIPLYAKNSENINAEFQKEFPNITVQIEHISDNYEAVLKTKLSTGNPPDVFNWLGYNAIKPFVDAGQVVDLSGNGFEGLLYPNYVESGKQAGKLYGVPTQVQTLGLLYNKDVFAKVGITETPQTITQLKDAAQKIKAAGIQPFASGLKEQWVCYDLFWFAQAPFVDDMRAWSTGMNEGKGTFLNNGMPGAFALFDFIFANSGNRPLSVDFAEMCHQIASGSAAMGVQGDWSYEETEKIDPNANLGMAGLPVSENPDDAIILVDVAEIVFVSSAGKNQEAAKVFIKWLLSKNGAAYLGAITKTPTPANTNPAIDLNPFARDGSQWVADGKKTAVFPWNYWAPGIMDVAGKDLQEYFSKSMTLRQLVKDLDENWAKNAQPVL